MIRNAIRIFLVCLFFGLLFFYQKNAFAADYFFDDFNDTSIDSTKWDINNLVSGKRWCADDVSNLYASGVWFDVASSSCHGTLDSLPLGNVNVANGEVAFSAPTSRSFPYMSSGPPNNFIFPPTGDFAFEIRLKFNSVTLHGTGAVALYWGDTTTLGNNPPKGPDEGLFGIWNDGYTQVRAVLLGQNVFLGRTFDYHKYRLEYQGGKYSVFFDDRLVVSPSSSSVRPTAILIGNPAFAFWNPWDWSDFSIDYVKVEKLDLAPEPFLELPWNYQSQGKSFEDVVFHPFSWFDHQYPLQNFCCSFPVMNYTGKTIDDFYRSHNGYDYSTKNGVVLNTSVLAAAPGWATFKPASQSAGAGNIIKIDHENGYQSWYQHLSPDALIVSSTQGRVFVSRGQKVGEVGMTGRTTGPHIHFSVFKDANNNGNFNDDYPWGFTDPLGWEGTNTDPWTLWTNDPPEKVNKRFGTSSHNLFIKRAPPKQQNVSNTGGSVSLGDIVIDFITNTFNTETKIITDYGPFESNGLLKSVKPSFFINAFNSFGEKVTELLQPATITYDYTDADLLNIKESTLNLYWFNESLNKWEPLPSTIDVDNKRVSAQTTHFSQFALMGEVKDLILPVTNVIISGDKGEEGWYRSDVNVELLGSDNEGGVGLMYTLYSLNSSDWFEYKDPIVFSGEGTHEITYQSFDKAENKEDRKTITFSIDKTPPEAEIKYNLSTFRLEILGIDSTSSASVDILIVDETKRIKVTDIAGNTLDITGEDEEEEEFESSISLDFLQYNAMPLVNLNSSRIWVKYGLDSRTKALKQLEQKFEVKDQLKIKLKYSSKTGKTKVITKVKGKEKVKEELPGMRLLKLTTERGTLKYSY